MSDLNLELLHDWVMVLADEPIKQTTTGIYVNPDVNKPTTGVVVETGNCKNGYEMTVKVGDRIKWIKGSGIEVTRNETKYLLMKEEDILYIDKTV